MYEATFSITDSSAYTGPTGDADCRIELWCNDHTDLLYISGTEIEPLLAQIRSDIGIETELRRDEEAVVITSSCLKEHEVTHIERYLQAYNCLLLPPLRYENGAKQCRILALESANLTDLYAELVADGFEIDVRAKREISTPVQSTPLLTLDDVLPELTERQRDVLTLAVEWGYYDLPRETTTADLADEIGVSRRTVEDHLRRAERKLLTSLVSYLY
ncbi:helix-turn-helix domain-containing protein [Natronolimnobius baerhuensis]|uniref:Transcriptional regulator n=1 Tax=Natronolimnobius baerhuensis TaxID=253108 RepID=A0A202E444_9EURY|nr:helix-turn-helix domain-containing protein [Natronolimnobius baerhuensis]OVE83063.1 transcriptional regulator [Natronolimnobius baerhuensis]